MIQPGQAGHRPFGLVEAQPTADRLLGAAVVVTGVCHQGAFLAESFQTIEDRRSGWNQGQIEVKGLGGDPGVIPVTHQAQFPVPDPGPGMANLGPRQGVQGSFGALGMEQMAQRRVRDGRMGQDELTGGEAAGIVPPDPSAYPEEGHLKTPLPARRILQPAGDVPPFGAIVRVGTAIPREHQGTTGQHRGEVLGQGRGVRGQTPAQHQ